MYKLPKIPPRLGLLGLVGLFLLVSGNFFGACSQQKPDANRAAVALEETTSDSSALESYRSSLAAQAERVLSQIDGAGRVVVSVTVREGVKSEIALNQTKTTRKTQEKDTNGTSRLIEENNDTSQPVMARLSTSGEQPIVLSTQAPEIEGVVVVAAGAKDPGTKLTIAKAAGTLFGLPAHRIQVFAMKTGD